ncbi:MAG: outer membrane lipoprotein-sorting protein [Pseudomonadota bacterium]
MRSGYFFLLSVVSLFLANEGQATQSVYDILKKADESRGNVVGISWEVIIESIEADRAMDTVVYNIKARGFDISGLSLEPPKYKGNKVLMTNNNMWFYKPGLSKPIPIAQRQKLMGNAAYGDIASTNYAEDYEPAVLPDETVDGEDCHVFDLKSKSDKTTYDKIKYWVSKKRLVGIKADYYTVSGKKFKTADMEFSNTVKVDGKTRPFISKITMRDTLINENLTYMHMNKPRLEALPDYIFNLNLFMK